MSSNPTAFSFGQTIPNTYDTSNSQTWPTYEPQFHQPYGSTPNHSNQSSWATGSGTDEFGRTLREGDREKEGRGGKDVRGALREATGWDERKSEVERHNGSGNNGNNGNEPTRGGWSGGKHKKEKKPAKVACLFFQKGNCKNGDGCRFSHDKGGGGGSGGGKRRGGGSGGGAGTAGWPSSMEMEY